MPTEAKYTHRSADPLLTIREAADRLDMSVETVRRRIAAGKLRVIRDGRIIRIHPDDLEKYIADHRGR